MESVFSSRLEENVGVALTQTNNFGVIAGQIDDRRRAFWEQVSVDNCTEGFSVHRFDFMGIVQVFALEIPSRYIQDGAIKLFKQGQQNVLVGNPNTDFSALAGSDKVRIVANLPYNVGTQLLVNWLETEPWPPFFESLTLMFQREVAERIVAKPGDGAYGRLGVLAGWRTEAKIQFDVPPQAFWPPPKVTSSVVRLEPRAEPVAADGKRLSLITQHAFGQRRKMLRQSLKALGGQALLDAAGIDGARRAETLSIEEFCRLANARV